MLEELRFASTWITNDTNVDIAAEVHALGSLFMDTAHELEQQALLDDLMSVYSGCDTVDEASIDIVGVNHRLQLVKFLFC